MLKIISILLLLNFNVYALDNIPARAAPDHNKQNRERLPSKQFIISPVSRGWYGADPIDIKAVSQSAASTLLKYMPSGLSLNPVILKNDNKGPMTLFNRGKQSEYIILVNISGQYWAQLAYQFSHELCHILSNYEATKRDENQWFEESLCEAASIHAVNQMSNIWKTNPPYPSWQNYSTSLQSYYKNILAEPHRYLQANDSIPNWYQRERVSLRLKAEQRNKNEIIGTRIYLFFKENPYRWQSIRYINIGNINNQISLQQYLQDWENNLPTDLKHVAKTIASWFKFNGQQSH